MMDADFDEADINLLTDIVGRLGLADVVNSDFAGKIAKNFYAGSVKGKGDYLKRVKVTRAVFCCKRPLCQRQLIRAAHAS